VKAEYTGFPEDPLMALPRRVRTGYALLRLKRPNGEIVERIAWPLAPDRLEFVGTVPPAAKIQSVSVEDGCGNTT
jgi:hypothetical protein